MDFDPAQLWNSLQTFLLQKGLDLLGALVVVVLAWIVAGWVRRWTERSIHRSKVDDTLASFFSALARAAVLVLGIMAALQILAVPLTSAVAVIAAAGLAIALAFQSTLSNFASGVLLLTFRPFRQGDFVEVGGASGTVTEIGLFFTILTTPDNVRITVPNSKVSGETIKNVTAHDTRRIDLVVGVSYDEDLGLAMETIHETLGDEERVLDDPEPQVAVSEMGDSAIGIVVRPWVQTPDYWPTRFALTHALKERLEAAGCSFPYPQRDVHLFQEDGEGGSAAAD